MENLNFLDFLPPKEIMKYSGNAPRDGYTFTGLPKAHPTDRSKLLFICDPLGESPAVIELKVEDVIFAEDVHAAVTETGEGLRVMKIYVRRGARGVLLEPFEVGKNFPQTELREKFARVLGK
jgi:hypothetical protein